MIALTADELALAVGGSLHAHASAQPVTGPVVVDSRQVTRGALFVAMKGEHVDGHDFAAAAVAAGASLVLAEREFGDLPCVITDDTVAALGRLARYVLGRLPDVTVVGVTGSSGKTSTKDLVAQVLSRHGSTVAPRGSFNNEIGLPLTVLSADAATRYLVLEMGARSPGHIAYLCEIARPSIGVVLNVGLAHVGEFGSKDATAKAKAELVAALPPTGTAVLNVDDPYVSAMRSATVAKVLTYGANGDIRAADARLDNYARPRFTLRVPGGSWPVQLNLHGEHQIGNALAAAAVARAVGMDMAVAAEALSAAAPESRWRMEVTDRADGVTIVNDAYNANPDSTRAALTALVRMASTAGTGRKRRTWAVLGEMLELGERSAAEHEAIGRLAAQLEITRLVAVGEGARPILTGAARAQRRAGGRLYTPDADAAVALLRADLRPGDVVLVKASRGIGLERVADALLAGASDGAPDRGGPA